MSIASPTGTRWWDRSLDVIRFVLNPTFTDAEVLLKPPSATSIRPTLWTAPLWQGRPVHPQQCCILHSALAFPATMAAASKRPREGRVNCALPTVGG